MAHADDWSGSAGGGGAEPPPEAAGHGTPLPDGPALRDRPGLGPREPRTAVEPAERRKTRPRARPRRGGGVSAGLALGGGRAPADPQRLPEGEAPQPGALPLRGARRGGLPRRAGLDGRRRDPLGAARPKCASLLGARQGDPAAGANGERGRLPRDAGPNEGNARLGGLPRRGGHRPRGPAPAHGRGRGGAAALGAGRRHRAAGRVPERAGPARARELRDARGPQAGGMFSLSDAALRDPKMLAWLDAELGEGCRYEK